MDDPAARLACPRCDKTPLRPLEDAIRCDACKVDFPIIAGIPWLFAEPDAALAEWRGRLQFALQHFDHEIAGLEKELGSKSLRALTQGRLQRYKSALEQHRLDLEALLEPVGVLPARANYETYLALRTRLPADQGINTYYANVHRDWAWGAEENAASLEQIRTVLGDADDLGHVLVPGCGAGRLAYDIHMELGCTTLTAMDFNPLLMLVAEAVTRGRKLDMHEFPIAPLGDEDDAVLRTLAAPRPVREGFQLMLGDVLRAPYPAGSFDTVVTPWLIDIVSEDFPLFAARINHLLSDNGRWVNFGSLAFSGPLQAQRYNKAEIAAIVIENGFSEPQVTENTIPYMCSPASRHGRQETVFSFCATKERNVKRPARHRALPDWLVTCKEPVPLSPAFRSQTMSTRIYAFIMSLIDGRRSIRDMAEVMEQQKLMTKAEAEAAIRNFMTRMYDDAQKPSGF